MTLRPVLVKQLASQESIEREPALISIRKRLRGKTTLAATALACAIFAVSCSVSGDASSSIALAQATPAALPALASPEAAADVPEATLDPPTQPQPAVTEVAVPQPTPATNGWPASTPRNASSNATKLDYLERAFLETIARPFTRYSLEIRQSTFTPNGWRLSSTTVWSGSYDQRANTGAGKHVVQLSQPTDEDIPPQVVVDIDQRLIDGTEWTLQRDQAEQWWTSGGPEVQPGLGRSLVDVDDFLRAVSSAMTSVRVIEPSPAGSYWAVAFDWRPPQTLSDRLPADYQGAETVEAGITLDSEGFVTKIAFWNKTVSSVPDSTGDISENASLRLSFDQTDLTAAPCGKPAVVPSDGFELLSCDRLPLPPVELPTHEINERANRLFETDCVADRRTANEGEIDTLAAFRCNPETLLRYFGLVVLQTLPDRPALSACVVRAAEELNPREVESALVAATSDHAAGQSMASLLMHGCLAEWYENLDLVVSTMAVLDTLTNSGIRGSWESHTSDALLGDLRVEALSIGGAVIATLTSTIRTGGVISITIHEPEAPDHSSALEEVYGLFGLDLAAVSWADETGVVDAAPGYIACMSDAETLSVLAAGVGGCPQG